MKTDPQEIAASSCPEFVSAGRARNFARYCGSAELIPCMPQAVAANVMYVGALSRKLDRPPDAQKNSQGSLTPNLPPAAFMIKRAGVIVTKIPANRMATSVIGTKLKRLLSWTCF